MTDSFAQVRIEFLTDKRLTPNARLLGIYWADKDGLPDGWDIRAKDVKERLGLGRDAFEAAVRCLKDHEYATTGQVVRDPKAGR